MKKKRFLQFLISLFFLSSLRFSRRRSRSSVHFTQKKNLSAKRVFQMEISLEKLGWEAIEARKSSTRRTNLDNVDTFRHSRASFRSFFDHIPLRSNFSDTEFSPISHFVEFQRTFHRSAIVLTRIRWHARSRLSLIHETSEFERGRWNNERGDNKIKNSLCRSTSLSVMRTVWEILNFESR